MITVDELYLSGYANNYLNPLSYVFSSSAYWTLSPSYFGEQLNRVGVFQSYETGYANGNASVTSNKLVRPVINLNANVEITGGIGTQNEPYIVKTI